MNRVKILFVLGSLGGGGAERVTLHLLRHLDRKQFALELALLKGPEDYAALLPADVVVHRLGVRARYAVLKLSRLIGKAKPDLVFSTAPHVDESLCLAVRLLRHIPKVVLRSPNYPSLSFSEAPFYVRRLAKWAYRSADLVIAATQAMREDMEKKFNLSPQRISMIPNPVDFNMIQVLCEEPVSHPWFQRKERERHPLIISMGRLEPQKGFKYLLEAFSQVVTNIPAKLVVLGRGSQLDALQKLCDKLGIASNVQFLGFQKNPYKFLANADLFVLSSLWEGFPNALVEAMACGIPAVSTDCPSGPREIIVNGEDGILVPPGDAKALSRAIAQLIADPPLREKMGKQGQKSVRERFNINSIVKKYEELFLKVLENDSPR